MFEWRIGLDLPFHFTFKRPATGGCVVPVAFVCGFQKSALHRVADTDHKRRRNFPSHGQPPMHLHHRGKHEVAVQHIDRRILLIRRKPQRLGHEDTERLTDFLGRHVEVFGSA